MTADQSLQYVSVVLGNSDGTFRPPVTTDTRNRLEGVPEAVADFNGDGKLDILISDATAGITGVESGITVNAASAGTMIVTGFLLPVTAGAVGNFTVTARDPYGNRATGYTGTIHVSSSDARATLPGNYTFTATDHGMHTFTGLTLKKKGKQNILVTDTLNSSLIGSAIINVL